VHDFRLRTITIFPSITNASAGKAATFWRKEVALRVAFRNYDACYNTSSTIAI